MKTEKEIEKELANKEKRVQYWEVYGSIPGNQELVTFKEEAMRENN